MSEPTTLDPQAGAPEASSHRPTHDVPDLRARRERMRAELLELLGTTDRGGVVLARRHAELADALLCDLYEAVMGDPDQPPLLLGAVGGYGRQLLGLESDLDICFVTEKEPAWLAGRVEAMLYPLWDAGISVGHQVVQVSSAATDALGELTMATELLDFRPLAGELALADSLCERLGRSVFSGREVHALIAQLEQQAAARHERYGDSVYLLEPDVKNGTGSLRDLDFALWAARARFGTGELRDLAARGLLTRWQLESAEDALDFLWTVRNHLHQAAGRKSDRLTFGQQERVALSLGYGRRFAHEPSETRRTGAMVEAFMSDYYRAARTLALLRDQLLGHARRRPVHTQPRPRPLGDGLVICEGRVGLAEPEHLRDKPLLALSVYRAAVANDTQVLSRTRDAITVAAATPAFCEQLRESEEASELFLSLLCNCKETRFPAGSILAELHEVGLLLAMIPEFSPVVGRVHHDVYHVYTVDVHSIAAVDRLRALTRGELASQHPLACRLAAEVTRPRVLFLATLLHDVGKDIGGANHAQRGAVLARTIAARLRLQEEEVDDVCDLVLKHLAMYIVAVRRDPGDPATVAEFAREVRGREGLRELYLLTVADLSTTSPGAMTSWKSSMLGGLLRATDAHLAGQVLQAADRVSRVRAQVRSLWTDAARARALDAYLESMPERYFLTNSPSEIVAHAELATATGDERVTCALLPTPHEGTLELCVVADVGDRVGLYVMAGDRPGLLAAITAAISTNGLAIQTAQVHSRALPEGTHQAVDLFWVRPRGREVDLQARVAKLKHDLTAVLEGEVAPAALMKPPRRPSWSVVQPKVPTEILFDHHGASSHTIIEVLTQDRFGLLYLLAGSLYALGLSISVARISTEGDRAIDVFYVSEADGTKLAQGARTDEVRTALASALAGSGQDSGSSRRAPVPSSPAA